MLSRHNTRRRAASTAAILGAILSGPIIGASGEFSAETQCTSEEAISIWTSMPSCRPRETIVKVPQMADPRLFQIVPEYVSVERCSGTCHQGNKYHNCIPTQTSVVKKQVMIQRLNSTGHLYSTCSEVDMEQHDGCTCGCRITEADCQSNQYFNQNLCRCECVDRAAKATCLLEGPHKMWDEANCRCRCTESYSECSTGHFYDNIDRCSCIPDLRPASSVPVVALMVALIGTLTCLLLVAINYRKTRKVLAKVRAQQEETRNFARSISRQTELRLQQMTPDELDLVKETAILRVDTDVD